MAAMEMSRRCSEIFNSRESISLEPISLPLTAFDGAQTCYHSPPQLLVPNWGLNHRLHGLIVAISCFIYEATSSRKIHSLAKELTGGAVYLCLLGKRDTKQVPVEEQRGWVAQFSECQRLCCCFLVCLRGFVLR